jgi:hypothetical protein
MMAYLSYVASHWELVVVCVVGVAALGYVSFILHNWKTAVAAVAVACCGLAYQHADVAGYERRVAEDVAAQTQVYKERIDALNSIALKNAMQAKSDSESIKSLEKQSEETPKNDSPCLDRAAASRVRNIK